MSLTIQSIRLSTDQHASCTFTMPAKHIYPFIIHRSIEETTQKENGERKRYSKKHCVSHLFTGALLGVFGSYEDASLVVEAIKEEPIWLMPSHELMSNHPDWKEVSAKVRELLRTYINFN
mgnify:CR=1 FL=1